MSLSLARGRVRAPPCRPNSLVSTAQLYHRRRRRVSLVFHLRPHFPCSPPSHSPPHPPAPRPRRPRPPARLTATLQPALRARNRRLTLLSSQLPDSSHSSHSSHSTSHEAPPYDPAPHSNASPPSLTPQSPPFHQARSTSPPSRIPARLSQPGCLFARRRYFAALAPGESTLVRLPRCQTRPWRRYILTVRASPFHNFFFLTMITRVFNESDMIMGRGAYDTTGTPKPKPPPKRR